MKILHVCLASFYIDNYSYQENMLPKFHKELGLDVEIIASLVSFDQDGKPILLKKPSNYINEYLIPVTRLKYKTGFGDKRLRKYVGTLNAIKKAKPDIIFIHGCQFWDIKYVVKYVKENPNVKVYVDNHADFSNSANNWLSRNILHKKFWKYCANLILPYTEKFYGVLPARVNFLIDLYQLPKEKVELLVMGADDNAVEKVKRDKSRDLVRHKYNIEEDDFLIITGGKIDNAKKQTLTLMEAVKNNKSKKLKLIVFGSIINELKEEVLKLVDNKKIQYIEWIESNEIYSYLDAADLAVFPGRHSVLWEQAVGIGLPCVFKYWEGTTHIDLNGNSMFLYNDSLEEISKIIELITKNNSVYDNMKKTAEMKGMAYFSYKEIAARAIELQ